MIHSFEETPAVTWQRKGKALGLGNRGKQTYTWFAQGSNYYLLYVLTYSIFRFVHM